MSAYGKNTIPLSECRVEKESKCHNKSVSEDKITKEKQNRMTSATRAINRITSGEHLRHTYTKRKNVRRHAHARWSAFAANRTGVKTKMRNQRKRREEQSAHERESDVCRRRRCPTPTWLFRGRLINASARTRTIHVEELDNVHAYSHTRIHTHTGARTHVCRRAGSLRLRYVAATQK